MQEFKPGSDCAGVSAPPVEPECDDLGLTESRNMEARTSATTPVLHEAKLNLVSPSEPVIGRVVFNKRCLSVKSASFVHHIAIDTAGTPLAGNFLPGQVFGVIPPGLDDRGRPHKVRFYSVASPWWGEDGEGNVVSTIANRLIDERKPQRSGDDPDDHRLYLGVCSNYLCDLREGDEVKLSGPHGKSFLLPKNPADHDYLFIATGTGIAPFIGMVQELFEHPGGPRGCKVHLVMGAPYTTDLIYDGLFRNYQAKHDSFHYHRAISREPRPGSDSGVYVDSVIDEAYDRVFGPLLENSRTLVYVCGVAGMQIGLFRLFARRGLADSYLRIRKDEVAAASPDEWASDTIKRHVKPTRRCMLEIY